LRIATILAHPVIPTATEAIWKLLGQAVLLREQKINELKWGQLKPGMRIAKPAGVFPRIDKADAIERMEKMEQESSKPAMPAQPAAAAAPTEPVKIGIEDFMKVEMRVGQVQAAERVAGADKLLKLMVDIGTEVRQVVAGIATAYEPEKLVGRKVVVVVNLAPRKLRGVESNGMILAASIESENRPILAGFLEEVPVGTRLK
jgi:methionyl-tRNA synthetase